MHNTGYTFFNGGSFSFSDVVKVNVGIPKQYELNQNYPNPFYFPGMSSSGRNPETTIKYQLPKKTYVKIEIYNLLGQRVKTLVDKNHDTGYYSVKWDGKNVLSGVYIYILKAGNFTAVRKMIIIQ